MMRWLLALLDWQTSAAEIGNCTRDCKAQDTQLKEAVEGTRKNL
jgi:hypothetical protein